MQKKDGGDGSTTQEGTALKEDGTAAPIKAAPPTQEEEESSTTPQEEEADNTTQKNGREETTTQKRAKGPKTQATGYRKPTMEATTTEETGTGEGTALVAAPSANIRWRTVVKSEPVAVTTQEEVDGQCEKAMRIAGVEQIELGNIMELSIMGHLLKWTRQSNLLGGVSLRRADGWNLKNHSQLTVTRPDPPSTLVVTMREGEREKQLKYTGVEEMRVVTNDRHKAEQIKVIQHCPHRETCCAARLRMS